MRRLEQEMTSILRLRTDRHSTFCRVQSCKEIDKPIFEQTLIEMSLHDMFHSKSFWHNGPSPGAFYNFPASPPNSTTPHSHEFQHSQAPTTTGTSVLGLKFDGGVIISADILGSYGSLARFRNCPRVMKVNKNTIMGAGGDYADFQYLQRAIEQKVINETIADDDFAMKPKSLYCWLTRIMYNQRSRFDPLWNYCVVGGLQDGVPDQDGPAYRGRSRDFCYTNNDQIAAGVVNPVFASALCTAIPQLFLGAVDLRGMAYEDKCVATGYGAHIALPLLRDALEKMPLMNEQQATEVIQKCMEVLYYRDARSFPKYQIACITSEDVKISEPQELQSNWEVAHMISGF